MSLFCRFNAMEKIKKIPFEEDWYVFFNTLALEMYFLAMGKKVSSCIGGGAGEGGGAS